MLPKQVQNVKPVPSINTVVKTIVPVNPTDPILFATQQNTINNNILNLFQQSRNICGHRNFGRNIQLYGPFLCEKVIELMNNILNNNMIIADCNIDYFYSLIVH